MWRNPPLAAEGAANRWGEGTLDAGRLTAIQGQLQWALRVAIMLCIRVQGGPLAGQWPCDYYTL